MADTMLTQTEQRLRQAFKQGNPLMVALWRLGLGQWVNVWPEVGGRVLVLGHIGRKSGRLRRTPVNYAVVEGKLYCLSGFGAVADWYRNILANPAVEVWLPEGWWAGVAEEMPDDERRLPLLRQVLIASGLAARLAGLDPKTMSDESLASTTESYRLIHIRRAEARTGPGGPGDLAWVWPLATLALLVLLWQRRRTR